MEQATKIAEAPLPPLISDLSVSQEGIHKLGQISAFFLENYLKWGSVFRIQLPNGPLTVLAGAEANLFMSLTGKEHFRAHEFRQLQNTEFGVDKTLLSLNGEEHYQWRKVQKRGYSRSAMNRQFPRLVEMAREVVDQWQVGQSLLVADFMTALIAQQIGLMVMHRPPGDYVTDIVRFVRVSVSETVAQMPRRLLDSEAYRRSKARALEFADKVIEEHRTPAAKAQREPDLIDDLLASLAEKKIGMSDQELRIAVLTPYVGGLDSTANTCAFMLYALLKHPAVLARVMTEVDEVFAQDSLTPATLKGLKELHHAALETLRMYPVSPAIQGVVSSSFEFAGYQIAQGENLAIGTTVPHYLPEFFPEPYKFDIDRYVEPRNEHLQPGVFSPYGLGEHICLGAGQAEALIMLTLATLLHHVNLELDPTDYELRIRAMPTPAPDDKLRVRVIGPRLAKQPSTRRND